MKTRPLISNYKFNLIKKFYWERSDSKNLADKIISKLVNKKMKKSIALSGSYIGNPNNFESIPTFPHGILGIFISGAAHIGKGCIIYQHVTIGSNMLPDSKKFGAPNIGDNVFIGVGAKIIGNCRIGSNCRIGANTVVVNDVPDNCVVVNAPLPLFRKIIW